MWLHAQQGRLLYVSGLLHKAASDVRRALYRNHPGKWKWQPRLFVVDLTGDTPQLRYKGHYEPPRNAWPHEPWAAADKVLADLGSQASADVAPSGGVSAVVARRLDPRDCGGYMPGQRLQVWAAGKGGADGRWVDLRADNTAECEAWLHVLLELPRARSRSVTEASE